MGVGSLPGGIAGRVRGALGRGVDPGAAAAGVDAAGLRARLEGDVAGEVRFDTASLGLYATDASNFRQIPIGVVVPRDAGDVEAVHAACREFGAPITARGAGTSLSGEAVNVAVVVDFSKHMDGILEIDAGRRLARVQPGAINEQVNHAAGEHGLVFGPDPSTHAYCTIGGNIGNNSCGIHSVQARLEGEGGRTSDNLEEMEVLLYDGTRMRVGRGQEGDIDALCARPGREGQIHRALRGLRDRYADEIRARYVDIPRRVSGYNLDELLPEAGFNPARALVGTEGTCATVLEATLNLIPSPSARSLLVVGYEDIFRCGDHVPRIMEHRPIGLEGLDDLLITHQHERHMHEAALSLLPGGGGWLLVEVGGESPEDADERARRIMRDLESDRHPPVDMRLLDDPGEEARLWKIREAGLAATAFPPDSPRDHWPGWEDSAVAPEHVGDYMRDLRRLYDRYGYEAAMYGHLGDGCIHSRIDFDLRTAAGIRTYRAFLEEAAELVVSYGGSLSGEHGDGQQRAELLDRMYGPELLEAFRRFKRIWDPDGRMNPGKVVDPRRLDEDLRLGTDHDPWRPSTAFSYADDGHDFAHAALRCVGVGKCRIPSGVDVMCPSYMVTREEKHTTRGRARLLFEMLQGDVVRDGWRSQEVHDALDLCLACKGCTGDCPVNVDMPTYKAEFLHGHYRGRLRPREAYALGLIDQAARVAKRAPGLANLATQTPGLAGVAKRAANMAAERRIPPFAPHTLRDWFHGRDERNPEGPKVILWPDTFNNHFHPNVGIAAVEALEAAGYRVTMPRRHVCCGRPLYDYGMLDLARRYLAGVLDELREDIRAGVPLVGVEPSCLATFRDELVKLMGPDDDARRLAQQSYHFAEFLEDEGVEPPPLRRRALVWGHCHQKATGGMDPEHSLLRRMGVEITPVTGGCCGLAGSFGFEAQHYEISMGCGEQALLPAVRDLPTDDLVVADGFSCKTQIAHGTERGALHVAEVMALARRHGPDGPVHGLPEDGHRPPEASPRRAAALLAGAAALAGGAAVAARRGAR